MPAPLYAADGANVLEEWLSIDADALADLVASGAIVGVGRTARALPKGWPSYVPIY